MIARTTIVADSTPAPPWAGVKFSCKKCGAEYQLEAGDACELRLILNDHLRTYDTPPCWNCEQVNVIHIDAPANDEQEGNAS